MIPLFLFTIGKSVLNPPVLAESTHTYDVLHYYIRVDLPLDSRYLDAHVTIAAKSEVANLDSVTLHLVGFTVDSVLIDGTLASFSHPTGEVRIKLPSPQQVGDSFNIDIFYHGYATGSPYAGYVYFSAGGEVLHPIGYTMAEPYDARYWLACFDEPWDKAEYGCDLEVTVPDSFTVCANGTLVSVADGEGRRTFHWKETHPIATYLIHFGASIYVRVPIYYHSLLIDNYVWPEDSAKAVKAFANLPHMFDLYDSLYGPYPFGDEKYGHDAVYPCAFGGMEHQTMTTLHRYYIVNGGDWVIAHELSHQWWGDMVTCIDWRDIWLNEGFATYSDALFVEYMNGHQAFLDRMRERAKIYFREDSTYHRPIYDPPMDSLFNYAYTYCKASWVLHMLRYLGGDSLYYLGLRNYRDSLAYGNASTYDLCRIVSRIYGTDLTWFFNEWIFSPGHPEYDVDWGVYPEANRYRTRIRIAQVQTNSPIFHLPVEIRLRFDSGDTLIRFPIQDSVEIFEVITTKRPIGLEVDPNEWILNLADVEIGVAEEPSPKPVRIILPTICAGLITITADRATEVQILDPSGRVVDRIHLKPGKNCYRPRFSSGVYFLRKEATILKKFIYLDRSGPPQYTVP